MKFPSHVNNNNNNHNKKNQSKSPDMMVFSFNPSTREAVDLA